MSKRVLIVEDEILIGMDLAQQLQDAGFTPLGPEGNVASALERLSQEDCDLAVLDVNLGTENSGPIAEYLTARNVPFVVTSGYSEAQNPIHFQGAPQLSKPVDIDALIGLLNAAS